MKPNKLRFECQQAAKKIHYAEVCKYIDEKFEPQFRSLARSTVVFYLPSEILKLDTGKARRDAVMSIPLDADPKHSRSLVEQGVKILFKRRRDVKLLRSSSYGQGTRK